MNKNNNLGRFLLVIAIVLWAMFEVYPPTSRDLVEQFRDRAINQDAVFTNILQQVQPLQAAHPELAFNNLQTAIGTNDITGYFTFIQAKGQLYPTTYILNQLQRDASGKIKLGLDLQGGTSFLVEMDTNKLTNPQDTGGAISQAVEVLRKRVDAFGVAEPVIQPAGGNQILIQLPGLSQAVKESARAQIQKAAYLEFRIVKDDSEQIIRSGQPIPPGYERLRHVDAAEPGHEPKITDVIVKRKPENGLAGAMVKNSLVVRDNMGNPEITFELNDDAAKRFAETTKENVGHQLAIILDGELYSAPVIQNPIETGNVSITGTFTVQEAQELANVLQNPLQAPLKIVESEDVDPTMGKDAIRSGISASFYAVLFVSIFMFAYYLLAGLTANIALVTNIIILMGVMCSVGTTFTLPGIAGVVLTIGMAVDANVLIYERLREELAKGKSLRGAIEAGYARAFGTIFDSHVTTLISSVILIFMGTGEIKGFGVTLTIGVAASLFTALVVTRLIFNFLLDRNWLKSLPMLHLIRSSKLDFMSVAKPLFILSWSFAIAAILYGGIFRGKQLFGVDFIGGDSTTYAFAQKLDVEQIRNAVTAAGEKDAQIQYQKDIGANTERLRVTTSSGSSAKVTQSLTNSFPQAKITQINVKEVGATVGAEIQRSAILASLFAMFGIMVYVAFRYEFSFSVGAVLAVIHDVLMTIGIFCLSGLQFSAPIVAAILTIIGFSINDTIVIFDRIREDLKLGVRGSFKDVMNIAINQTLSRTLITSGTVFIATFSLYVFGGGVIHDFAFTFLVGIITGTYSSIYIASALVLWWHKGERPKSVSQVVLEQVPDAKAQA